MNLKSHFLQVLLLIICGCNSGIANQDSIKTLAFKDYMKIVVNEHPLAKKAALQLNKGTAVVMMERGAFDPYLFNTTKEKYLNENQYYSIIESGIKIPTWFGVEFQLANDYNRGYYLNPENNSGTDGLWFAGISVPIGQGLLIDQRRADLRKAQIFEKATLQEQKIMLNDLLLEAGKNYWDWHFAYHSMKIFENASKVATERLSIIKTEAKIGEKPAIDTVEASIQLQNIIMNLQQAQIKEQNARALVSLFLWLEGSIPVELKENTTPVLTINPSEIWPESSTQTVQINAHPELIKTRLKIDEYTIDYRLTRDKLKPKVNLNYNFLNDSYLSNFENYSINNYTWGLNFAMPIFLRETRGELKFKSIMLTEMKLDVDYKSAVLNYKIIASENERILYRNQLSIQQKNLENYRVLFESERTMFSLGESSLFILNTREQNYISAQIKLIELLSKGLKSELSVNHAQGILADLWSI